MMIRKIKIEYFNEGLTVGKGNSGISAIYIFIFLSILVIWETFERQIPVSCGPRRLNSIFTSFMMSSIKSKDDQ